MNTKERAEKSAQALFKNDAASKMLGMRVVEVDEGKAALEMTVRPDQCNGLRICHGGILFSLADSAFAFASNSRNKRAVAQNCMVSFLRPAQEGDHLKAFAKEVTLSGRSGIYDVSVSNQSGEVVVEFRGFSRIISGSLFDE